MADSKFKTFFQNSNIKSFLFFLLLTTGLALLIKLSKTYSASRTLTIQVDKLDKDEFVSFLEPESVEVSIKGTGFALLLNQFNKENIIINAQEIEASKDTATVSITDFNSDLSTIFGNKASITKISPQQLKIAINSYASKEVAVEALVDLTYAQGYTSFDTLQVNPAKVTLIGAKSVLDTIDVIRTKQKTFTGLKTAIREDLEIDLGTSGSFLKVEPKTTQLSLSVSKYTEGTVEVPVQLKNESALDVRIFPKTINVSFVVSLENYDKVSASQFKIVCDFKNRTREQKFLIPQVVKAPEFVRNLRLSAKQVEFVIIE